MMHTLIKSLFAFCLLFFSTSSIAAEMTTLTPGTRIRMTAPTLFMGQLIGTIVAIKPDTLIVEHGVSAGIKRLKSGTSHFPIDKLSKLERSLGRRKNAVSLGGTAGLFSGIGALVLMSKTILSGEKSLAFLWVTQPVLITSTTLGILIARRERWQKIPLEALETAP